VTATLGRRLARLEEARTARALADFRAAFHAWAVRPDRPTREEAEARLAELQGGQSAAERVRGERLRDALEALLEPTTAPVGIARAAAAFAAVEEFTLWPGAPAHQVLAALAAHFRQAGD